MNYILIDTLESLDSLRHFYEIQKNYINKKAKQGMKENSLGMLTGFYFSILSDGTEEEKTRPTFINLKTFIEKHIDIKEITEKGITYTIKDKDPKPFQNVKKATINYNKYADMPLLHGDNTLIMLITRFEEFISALMKYIFKKFPQQYLDDRMVRYSDIESHDIDAIKELIIEREICEKMRDSYLSWFKLLENHNIKLVNCKEEVETLKER